MVERNFVINDEWNNKLAEAELVALGGTGSATYFVKDNKALKLLAPGQIVRVMENRVYAEVFEGKIESIEKSEVLIGGMENISAELRSDFKFKCSFRSVIMPIKLETEEDQEETEEPEPIEILSKDLSGGGIGFYTTKECSLNPYYELVIPILEDPMVVRVKLVRCVFDPVENRYLCGGRFVGLQANEEALLRKTIMRMQVLERRKMKERIEEAQEQEGEESEIEDEG